jgi:hypothetical protein
VVSVPVRTAYSSSVAKQANRIALILAPYLEQMAAKRQEQ